MENNKKGLTKETLSADFVQSGVQPTFKTNFEFCLVNPQEDKTLELTYFNHSDLWYVDYERTQGNIIINTGAALVILSAFITEDKIPEFNIPTVQTVQTNQRSGLNLDKTFNG